MCSLAKDIGIDLGTASVLIYVKDKGIVLNEPSVVAIDKDTGKLLKVGADAQAMLGRTPGNIVAIRPLREGVISDYEVTERMLKEFIHKVMGFQFFKPRAVIDAGIQAGARRVYLIEEPVAAAIGAGIDITQPDGHFIIDIGGGTSDIAVISLSGVVESASIKVAGDQFNEAVVKYMRRKHNLLIGERTAEEMKMSIGCVFPPEEEMTMEIKGRCLLTGLPKLITVTSTEMMDAFEEPVERIMEAVHQVLERTPPELVADISSNGIVMTGGGSLIRGFDKLVTARTGIHTVVAENAIQCVAEGTGKSLESVGEMKDGTMNLSPSALFLFDDLEDLFVALLGERNGVGQHGLALVAALVRVLLVLEGREVDEHVEPRALHGSLERQRRNAEVAHDIRIGRADERCEQVDGFQTDLHHRQGDLRAVAEARLHRTAANGLLGVILLGQGEGFDEHVEHLAVAVHHVHEALLQLVALGDGVENALAVVLKALFGEC